MDNTIERDRIELNLINQGMNGMTNRLYILQNSWTLRNRYANRIKVRNKNRLLVVDLQPENRLKL